MSRERINDLKHRVKLCTSRDVVIDATNVAIARTEIASMWASIEPTKGSTFARSGATVLEDTEKPTHTICIRARPDLTISVSAWVYEQRLKSAPRWYKILGVGDDKKHPGRFTHLICRLWEQSDDASAPAPAAIAIAAPQRALQSETLPDGVKL